MTSASHMGAAAGADGLTWPRHNETHLLLISRVADRSFALPAQAVERILWMAALISLPDAPRGVVGILNLQGATLPVVDPRPGLGLPPSRPDPSQHLIVMSIGTRYILWVDEVERIVLVQADDVDAVHVGTERALVPFAVRLHGALVPVLAPEALDPGPILRATGGVTR